MELTATIERQQRLIQIGVFGTAALIGFAESRGDRTVAIIVYLLVPLAFAAVAWLWFREVDRLRETVRGNERAALEQNEWRNELQRAWAIGRIVGAGVVAVTILSGFLIQREVRGIEDGQDPYGPDVWIVVGAAWLLVGTFAGILALAGWRQDGGESLE